MNDPSNQPRRNEGATFSREVKRKALRKLRAGRGPDRTVWFGLGMFGLIGWSVAVPALLGAIVGMWLDRHEVGRHSWTLALLVAGLCLGCMLAWHWVIREGRAMREGERDNENNLTNHNGEEENKNYE